ncbi:MAG: glycosyl hydrolase [Firmicutes bacterium]|nr:glycosyl hydrolase [Bacillota bacterium]
MLYPKSTEPFLSEELFQNPGSEYRGTPFWAWNCELKQDELLRQLDILQQMGLGGAHMHVRTGMATPYLSDEHMALIKACVEKCKENHMLAWLYDEDRWPSGAAGGIVTKEMQYRARHLLFTTEPYSDRDSIGESTYMSGQTDRSENGYLLACYDVVLDENGCLQAAERIGEADAAKGTKWYAYVETPRSNPWYNNQTYANTLDKKTIRRFIEVTYERYLKTVGEDFGGAVPAIFTDEPQFSRKGTLGFAAEKKDVILPWSDDVPETFRAVYGEDILAALPELFWELPGGKVSLIRYHYHDHIAERFAEAFADQCGKWCGEHGLMLTGHMMEEPTLKSQTAALGEAMRSYRSFQLPGIDMLCGAFEFTTAKQAQSAAHQYGRPGVMSELYGVTGWSYDFRGHKLQGDWQAALGITVRVQHLAWVSMKGEAKRDYPASINYQSPWWKDYSFVENHFARVNTALTRGRPLVRVGVIHPVESYWLHWGPAEQTFGAREQLDQNFQNVTKWLLNGCIDFDFISESLLPSQCEKGSAPLCVGKMSYDTIIVPGCETLRSTTLERLEAFRRAGGKLIFLGAAPALEDAVPSERGLRLWELSEKADITKEALLNVLQSARTVTVQNADGSRTENLIHQLREDGSGRWLFLAHSCAPYHKDIPVAQKIRITMEGEYSVRLYDTQTGEIRPMESRIVNGKTVLSTTIYDLDSLLLRYETPADAVQSAPKQAEAGSVRRLPVEKRVEYTLEEPNVYLMDRAEFALDDEPYQPETELLRADNVLRSRLGWPSRIGASAQPWTVPQEKIEHSVRLRFTVVSTMDAGGVKLALEDARLAAITCNGEAIPAEPDGWFTDRSIETVPLKGLKKGSNVIEIVLPFGRRTNVEWCYLLGDFGVSVAGEYREIVPLPEKLGFDNVVMQRLPYYGSNITYSIPVRTSGGQLELTVPHYDGTAVRVALDGSDIGYIAYPPYRLPLGQPEAGGHVIELTLLGNRENCFGPLHRADVKHSWIGPDAWRTQGASWTDSYRLTSLGLRSAPIITESETR